MVGIVQGHAPDDLNHPLLEVPLFRGVQNLFAQIAAELAVTDRQVAQLFLGFIRRLTCLFTNHGA